ncbi:MAG: PAS domain-containing protein [Burkholderiales bacterium]
MDMISPTADQLDARCLLARLDVPWPVSNFLCAATGFAGALVQRHARDTVSGELHPAMMFVDVDGARAEIVADATNVRRLATHVAPERALNPLGTADARSELYALGITLYQMLTGQLPFDAANGDALLHRQLASSAPSPESHRPGLPTALGAIVMKLLAKDAGERYQSALGLEADLRRCSLAWETDGFIAPFEPGAADLARGPGLPWRLHGRDHELARLREAHEAVCTRGGLEFVLIEGPAGIGKSALVHALQAAVAPLPGSFAKGKGDAYLHEAPFATLAQALQRQLRWVLSETEDELAGWSARLRAATHPQGRLLFGLLPELEAVIGPQPPVPELNGHDAEARFLALVQRLLGAFASAGRPLLLFLDDLQWADEATLALLEHLLVDRSLSHVLIIGACRPEPDGGVSAWARRMTSVRERGLHFSELTLAPLPMDRIANLLADLLHCTPERAATIAPGIHAQSRGNPFLVTQVVAEWARSGDLVFDPVQARWTWDAAALTGAPLGADAARLAPLRLARLPRSTREAVGTLSCLGTAVAWPALVSATGLPLAALEAALAPALAEGLLWRDSAGCGFAHDRIREAVYDKSDTRWRARAHLRVGRRWLEAADAQRPIGFVIIDQLNRGALGIATRAERARVASLNLDAARRARAATACVAALNYLEAGTALVEDGPEPPLSPLGFELRLERAICQLMLGRIEAAEPALTSLVAAPSPADAARACRWLVMLQVIRADYGKAVEQAIDCLRRVGIDIEAHPADAQLEDAYAEADEALEGRSVASLIALPRAEDPVITAATTLLAELFAPACFTDERLAQLHLCRMVCLSLRHGIAEASPQGLAWFGLMLGHHRGRRAEALQFAELAQAMVARHGFVGGEAKGLFALEIASGWVQPLTRAVELSRAAYLAGVQHGDVAMACYACHHLVGDRLARGDSLADVAIEIERGLAFVRDAGFRDVVDELVTQQRFVAALRGQTAAPDDWDGPGFDTAEFELGLTQGRMPDMVHSYWVTRAQAHVLAGHPEQAQACLAQADRWTWSSPVHVRSANHPFLAALVAARLGAASDTDDRLPCHRAAVAGMCLHGAATFSGRLVLIDAEVARLEGRSLDALRLYEQAIAHARMQGFAAEEGLAAEAAARCCAGLSLPQMAEDQWRRAHDAYVRWGAEGKRQQLETEQPFLRAARGAGRPDIPSEQPARAELERDTLIKAAESLAREGTVDSLLETLMRIGLEHARAQRGLLVLALDEGWQVEAQAHVTADGISVARNPRPLTEADVPPGVVRYVARTRSHVLIDGTAEPGTFGVDSDGLGSMPRSVLCLPLLRQSSLIGLIYFENALASRAFEPQRRALLEVIAAQAAIALENARAQTALRDSELRFRSMADANPDVVWITELSPERVVYASPSFERIWGLPVEDLYQDPHLWINGIHPEDRPHVQEAFGAWLTGDPQVAWEARFRVLRPDGSVRWIHERGVVIQGGQRVSGVSTDITQRRQAEIALRESETRYALAMEAARDGHWDWIVPTDEFYASPRMLEIYGFPPETRFDGREDFLRQFPFHPEDRAIWAEAAAVHFGGRAARMDVEIRMLRHGEVRWVHTSGLISRDTDGRPVRYTGSVSDVTDRKAGEAALNKSEQRHALAMEAGRDGYWDWLLDTDEFYASTRTLEIYGFAPEVRFTGRDDFLARCPFHPDDRKGLMQAAEACFSGRTLRFDHECRFLRSGQVRWVHLNGLLTRDGAGRPSRWTGSVSDVTDRKAGEVALRESEERFALAVEASNDGIWDLDVPAGRMFMSERAQRLHGLEPGAAVRTRAEWAVAISFHPDDDDERSAMMAAYLAGTVPGYDGEWRVRQGDGTWSWVRIRGLCVRDLHGHPTRMAGSISDIDARKRAEAALQQAHRLEAVGTLAGGIAHDFNNILGAILGFGDMALRQTRSGSRCRRDLEQIIIAGERGRALVERILAFSRTGVGERVAVNVQQVVQEGLELLVGSTPAAVRVEPVLAAAGAAVLGDSTQLHQLLMNLATNAIQAMPHGGTLRVTLDRTRLTRPIAATTDTVAPGEYVVLSVADSGVGIAPEIAERIFDPFFTTKDVGSGTGLGLSLVHGIVAEFRGAVNVVSAIGEGSTFSVFLPCHGDAPTPRTSAPQVIPRGAQQQVLVVDDEEPLARLLAQTLSGLGYVPVLFASAQEALTAFEAHPERFDAVITDERMPGLSGGALIRAMRLVRASLPVVLVSGYLGTAVVERAREAGADAVLRKPLVRAELAQALSQAIMSHTGSRRTVVGRRRIGGSPAP